MLYGKTLSNLSISLTHPAKTAQIFLAFGFCPAIYKSSFKQRPRNVLLCPPLSHLAETTKAFCGAFPSPLINYYYLHYIFMSCLDSFHMENLQITVSRDGCPVKIAVTQTICTQSFAILGMDFV
jgi:hypothetical protein